MRNGMNQYFVGRNFEENKEVTTMKVYESYNDLECIIDDLNERTECEKRKAKEKAVSQFSFKLKMSKLSMNIALVSIILGLIFLIKSGLATLIRSVFTDEKSAYNTEIFVIGSVFIIIGLINIIIYKFTPLKQVKGSYLYYKGKEYHYSDIKKIKISDMNIVSVFLTDGKSFRITGDYDNCTTFLVWSEKCGITFEGSKELRKADANGDINPKWAVIVIAVILLVCGILLYYSVKTM